MSKSKQKGTAYEREVLMFLRKHGVNAERVALHGSRDEGDLRVIARGMRIVIECKDVRDAGPALIERWRDETDVERGNADADAAILVRHLPGNGQARRGADECQMTLRDLWRITGTTCPATFSVADPDDEWISVSLAQAARWLGGQEEAGEDAQG